MTPRTCLITLGLLLGLATAAGADTLNLSSYYPAPFGAYDRMQLVPQAPIMTDGCTVTEGSSCCKEGSIYYYEFNMSDPDDPDANKIYLCSSSDSDGEWMAITGSDGLVWEETGNGIFPKEDVAPLGINVGIGTSTPETGIGLHIANGNLRLGGGDGESRIQTCADDPDLLIQLKSSDGDILRMGAFDISDNFRDILSLDGANMRVGIRTAAPQATLHITGANSPTAGAPELNVRGPEGSMAIERIADTARADTATLELVPGSPLGSTVDPNIVYKLAAGINNFQFGVYDETSQALLHRFMTFDWMEHRVGLGDDPDPLSRLSVKSRGNTSATGALQVLNADGDTTFYIADNGAVGVGTDTPLADLHVKGPTDVSLKIQTADDSAMGDSATLDMEPATGNTKFRFEAVTGYMNIYPVNKGSGTPTSAVTMNGSNGYIGIKVSDPSVELDVAGDIHFSGADLGPSSDRRLKKDIEPLARGLDAVMALHPVSFEYRTEEFPDKNFNAGTKAGFIAQEVEETIPHAVSQDEEGYYYLEDAKFLPYMVKAVQELDAELEDTYETLNQNMEDFSRRLDALDSSLQ